MFRFFFHSRILTIHGVETPDASGLATASLSGILTWSRVAIDAGNRSIAACDGLNQLKLMPSIYADLEPYDIAPICPDSAVIEYINDGPAACKGPRWVVGQLAADLQGKASIAQIYLPSGMFPVDGRVILPGTYALAQRVAKHPKLISMDTSPNLTLIMDAIAEGSFTYGSTDINFGDKFSEYRDEWLGVIRNKLKLGWAKYLPQLGEVLVVGGSAHLSKSLCASSKGRFKIAPLPQVANVKGMRCDG